MIVSVESENWIKSPWLTNLVASPPNPLHSIYFLPLVPLKVKLVIDVISANFSFNFKDKNDFYYKILKEEDFDFGEEQSNVQIIKGVSNADSGYYLVLAVHTDIAKRDEFLTKVVSAGQKDINFFYDVSSGKYFIYYEKYDDIAGATRALENKGTKAYNSKMSMVKIEN